MTEPWRHELVYANGIRFHCVTAGEGPLVLLLHGFPEFWYSWRALIPALSGRFRVVAPDLRGYNDSEKPAGGYDAQSLAADITGLIEALGEERAHLVGHDWGGVVAWWAASLSPERVARLAILNAPHPTAMARRIWRSPAQLRRSLYIAFFWLPLLPEWRLSRRGFQEIPRILRRYTERPLPEEEIARYVEALAKPGALRGALAYYRQLLREPRRYLRPAPPISHPTLVLWGAEDRALGVELIDWMREYAPQLQAKILPGTGHFPAQEAPQEVLEALLPFLEGAAPSPS